ncbi:hypothetical protein GW816_00830 [Candidatus Wolfebacteria bacterium]|nr:hypothetical protein [Parcubacteria group bacterium]NCO89538.1 hypothetical protein [Candidatus Wolfebacteria bacterium]NCP58654.1 hypothetical protein [Candidatus Wolfebacteria bacterium]NCQ02591.1 hypothetical protein [Candidatus Wolfebacteria bacterium]
MEEIIQKLSTFLNYFGGWFEQYIGSGLVGFIKALGGLFIKILEFFIDVIRWIMSYL